MQVWLERPGQLAELGLGLRTAFRRSALTEASRCRNSVPASAEPATLQRPDPHEVGWGPRLCFDYPTKAGRPFCWDSLPVWPWSGEGLRNSLDSAPWRRLGLPTRALKGQSSWGGACPGDSRCWVSDGRVQRPWHQGLSPRSLSLDDTVLFHSPKDLPMPPPPAPPPSAWSHCWTIQYLTP